VGLGGWRAALGGTLAGVGTIAAITALGIALAPFTLAAILTATTFVFATGGSALGIEKKIRETALSKLKPQLQEMRANKEASRHIKTNVAEAITKLGKKVRAAVDQVISKEEENLRNLSTAKAEDKDLTDANLARLEELAPTLEAASQALLDLRAAVKQKVARA
jgi:single-stranded DNA-specific DHH superfamily exonuclease